MARKPSGNTAVAKPPTAVQEPAFDGSSYRQQLPHRWRVNPHVTKVRLFSVELKTEGDTPVQGSHYTDGQVIKKGRLNSYDVEGATYFLHPTHQVMHVSPKADPAQVAAAIREMIAQMVPQPDMEEPAP
jgi:hypothetical protein